MSSLASIPQRYSSMNRSNFHFKTGFLPLLYDIFVLAKVLVIKSLLRMPTDNISTLTSDVSSVVHKQPDADEIRLCGSSLFLHLFMCLASLIQTRSADNGPL